MFWSVVMIAVYIVLGSCVFCVLVHKEILLLAQTGGT